MAISKKKKVASSLSDLEKLSGVLLLFVYLVILPLIDGWLVKQLRYVFGPRVSADVVSLVCFLLLFAAVVLLFHSFLFRSAQDFFHPIDRGLQTYFAALIGFYGLNELLFRVSHLLWGNMTNLNDGALVTSLFSAPRGMVLAIVVIIPILEEVLFRGLLFGWLREHSRAAAYLLSCGLFALLYVSQHGIVRFDLVTLFLLVQYLVPGLIFAWAYDRSGSIWASIFVHMTVNALAVWTLW